MKFIRVILKIYVALLLLLSLVASGKCQVLRVPVGVEAILFRPVNTTVISTCSINRGDIVDDTCSMLFADGFPFGEKFYFATSTGFDSVLNYLAFFSDSAGSFRDSFIYTMVPNFSTHPCSGCNVETKRLISSVDCFYDSLIHTRSAGIFFEPRKDSFAYLPGTNLLQIYNNRSEQISCDSWSLAIDPQYGISMTSTSDSLLKIDPLKNGTSSFSMSTSLPPSTILRKAYGNLSMHVRSASLDSIFIIPVRFFFFPAPASSVTERAKIQGSVTILPNPSRGPTKLIYLSFEPLPAHIHIFDQLGKDVMTVIDGMLDTGQHDFSFKLPQGMYYVRMETAEGVVTKKVVVE